MTNLRRVGLSFAILGPLCACSASIAPQSPDAPALATSSSSHPAAPSVAAADTLESIFARIQSGHGDEATADLRAYVRANPSSRSANALLRALEASDPAQHKINRAFYGIR